jgi:hypothetical protein
MLRNDETAIFLVFWYKRGTKPLKPPLLLVHKINTKQVIYAIEIMD